MSKFAFRNVSTSDCHGFSPQFGRSFAHTDKIVSAWLHQKTVLGLHFEDLKTFFSEKSKLDSVSRFVCFFAFFFKLPYTAEVGAETLERLHGNRVVQDKISSS